MLSGWAHAQNVLNGGPYSQNFDVMGATGTTLPANWAALRFAGTGTIGAALTPAVSDGSANSGNVYNAGTTNATDRALGILASGSTVPVMGTSFTNGTASNQVITGFTINATSEQWRTGNNAVVERVVFEYSTDATSLNSGTWTAVTNLDLIEIQSADNSNVAIDGNNAANRTAISGSVTGINVLNGGTFWIRWRDTDNSGSDGMFALDDMSMTYISSVPDVTPPTVTSLSPANGATNHSISFPLVMTFNENIQKGTGNITINNTTDGLAALVDVTSSNVTISGNTATINSTLQAGKNYSVSMPAGVFKDLSGNNYAGLTAGNWTFTTIGITLYNYDFNTCTPFSTPGSGFTQYSVVGDSVWNCTSFGINSTRGAQMNGFNNPANEDWFISPALNLTAFTVPILSFQERTKFAGPDLQILVSTNYSGTGDPNLATWTTLNAVLPAMNSDAWTLVDNINLGAYKTANTYVAFKYTSSTAAGAARTTLDDINIRSTSTAPAPAISLAPGMLNFDYVASGTNSTPKTFTFLTTNTTADVTFTAPANFQLSKDNTTYSNSITYTTAQQSGTKTAYVRYSPTTANTASTGDVTITSTGLNARLAVAGNSYPYASTLQVVNWNLNWFGSTTNGPTDDAQQQANVKQVMDSLQADLYALAEVVDTARLGTITRSLAGGYSYVVSPYASGAPTMADPNWAGAQKLAYIYKTSRFTNVSTRGLLASSASASSNWSTGRVPFLMQATVVNGATTAPYSFILVHGKANTGTVADQQDAYARRKAGAKELKDTLDASFSTSRIVLLGDFNDDLDSTIAPGIVPALTSYDDIVKDSTDGDSYKSVSLVMSRAGLRSTVSFPDVIDHVVVSNEVFPDYVPGSARIITAVESYITNYSSTTTDHYPVMSRYLLPVPPADLTAPTLVSNSPVNNAINVPISSTFSMTFSEPVAAGTGNILVKRVSDNVVVSTTAASALTINGAVASWTVSGLGSSTQYYVEVPNTAIKDIAGNAYAGFSGPGTWKFTTADVVAPTLVSFLPALNQVGVPVNPTPLVLVFSEPIAAGTGNIIVKKMIDGSIAATVPATSALISGNTAQFGIPGLANSTQYYVEIQNTAFKDLSGNAYAGITGSTTIAFFTTALTAIPTVNPATVELVISPNPTTSNLRFSFVPKAGKVSYQVIDGKGTIVLSQAAKNVTANKLTENMSLSGLASGTYLLRISNNGNFIVQPFVKR
ncbi:MAG: C-terminal target protein [Flaviaesturariibacter sp.]|nr:C-terminal target protein [Flaviaesturariibacter sp.]